MSKKIRLIRTTIVEFEPNPEYYEENATIEQMAEIEAHTDDMELQFSENVVSDDVTWEAIDENDDGFSQVISRQEKFV